MRRGTVSIVLLITVDPMRTDGIPVAATMIVVTSTEVIVTMRGTCVRNQCRSG